MMASVHTCLQGCAYQSPLQSANIPGHATISHTHISLQNYFPTNVEHACSTLTGSSEPVAMAAAHLGTKLAFPGICPGVENPVNVRTLIWVILAQ